MYPPRAVYVSRRTGRYGKGARETHDGYILASLITALIAARANPVQRRVYPDCCRQYTAD